MTPQELSDIGNAIVTASIGDERNWRNDCIELLKHIRELESRPSEKVVSREDIKQLYDKYCISGNYQTRHPHLMTYEGFVSAINSRPSDAVEFVEWAIKEGWLHFIPNPSEKIKWSKRGDSDWNKELTTSELYKLFLNSKT